MTDLLAARSQMAVSLGFHIVFAVVGIALPLMMVCAEWRYLQSGDPVDLDLAKRWAKGTAILFAVGAVSGTVLSFELGLLWPEFMRISGAVIGLPFALEGFAFFTEAVFLGIYLYGWDRIGRRAHIAAGLIVAASGAASAVFVVIANAWMNTPAGFRLVDGKITEIDVVAAMRTPAALPEVLHMLLAAYAAVGFGVAGIHAFLMLRGATHRFHRRALAIGLLVGAPAALLQPLSGDLSARYVAEWQPAKLAAMEGQFTTERGAPLRLGGWPDEERRQTRWAIEVPYALSLLAFHDPGAEVMGLDRVPRDQWPPVAVVHVAFQIMVALGSYLALLSAWAAWRAWLDYRARKGGELAGSRWFLRAVAAATPMGFIALEAGWTVTEVGRQPWTIYGVLRTAEAVTPMPGLVVPFTLFTLLYCLLAVIVAVLLHQQIVKAPREGEAGGAVE
jgi:cytochrome bd ubiquinol oxidase subunit I